jgi:hypothetical protein
MAEPGTLARVRQGLALGAVLWSLVVASAAVRAALAQPPDPLPRLQAEFLPLAPHLPRGEVGYPALNAGAEDAVRTTTPRTRWCRAVMSRVGQEFIWPAKRAPGGDQARYYQWRARLAGHRVFGA